MVVKRQCQRHIIKLSAEISAGGEILKGTTIRVSEKGLFVRSQKNFPAGTAVDITLHLTDNSVCSIKGIIRYVRNIDISMRQNGMGIEFTEKDQKYQQFIKAIEEECG